MVWNPAVAFFRRLLNFPRDTMARLRDKRRARRYLANPNLPVKVSVLLHGADNWTGSQAPHSRTPYKGVNREWAGPLVDLSSTGLSFLTLPAAIAAKGEQSKVRLTLDNLSFEIPCTVAYLRTGRDSARLGLALQFDDPATEKAYLQLLECLVMGATMDPWKPLRLRPNPTGLVRQQYRSENDAKLYVWREKKSGKPHSFELHLAGYLVRGEASALVPQTALEVFTKSDKPRDGITALSDRRFVLSTGEHRELRLLYRLVTCNLSTAVPLDVRRLLQLFTPMEE